MSGVHFQVCKGEDLEFHLEMKLFFLILFLGLISFYPVQRAYSSKGLTESPDRFEKFSNAMKGVRFTGFFTIDGSDRPPNEETYEIHSVQKFGEEDLWIFTARIKYGKGHNYLCLYR